MSAGHVGVTQEWVSANRANADIDTWYIEYFFFIAENAPLHFFFTRLFDSFWLSPAYSGVISHDPLLLINDSLLLREACCLSAGQRQLRCPGWRFPPLRSSIDPLWLCREARWKVLTVIYGMSSLGGTRWAPPSSEGPLGPKFWPLHKPRESA